MGYSPEKLTPTSTTNQEWALAWCRRISGDTSSQEVLLDPEWIAYLEATSLTVSSTKYYRPHAAVAAALRMQRDTTSITLLGGSTTMESAEVAASRILREGRWMDEAIDDALGSSVSVWDELRDQQAPAVLRPGW